MASKSSVGKSAKKRKHTSDEADKPVDVEDFQPKKKKLKKKRKKDAVKTSDSSSDKESAAPVQKLFNSHDDPEIWSHDEVQQLLDKVKEKYPGGKGNEISYRRSMTKINWDTVAVEPHSPDQCKAKFTEILTKVNSLRTLPEMIKAARNIKQAAPYVGVKPKHPSTVYMLFCQDYREKHKGTSLQVADLAKGYHSLSDKKRKKYEIQYEEEKAHYEKQMVEFKLKNPDLYPVKGVKQNTPKKSSDKVPKVVNPLTLYLDHLVEKAVAENKDVDRTEIRNRGKAKFASLKPKKRQKWLEEAVLANKDLEARLKIFTAKNPQNKVNSVILMRNAQRIVDQARGKPDQPQTAFKIFSQQVASQSSHLTSNLPKTPLMEQWKALSISKRMEYEKQALQNKRDYEKKYQVYIQNLPADEREKLEKEKELKKKSAVKSTELDQNRVTELDDSPANGDHHDSDDEMSDVIPDTQEPAKIILNSAKNTATKRPPTSSPDEEQMTKIKSSKKSSPSKSKKPVPPSPSTSDSSSSDDEEQSPSPTKPSVSPKKAVPSPKKAVPLPKQAVLSPKKAVPSPKNAVPSPKKVQKRKASSSSSSSDSDSSDEDETVKQPPKKTKQVTKKKSSSSSSDSDSSDEETVKQQPKKTNQIPKKKSSSSSSSSSSSDSENEVLTQKPVTKPGKKGTPSAPVTKAASSPVKTKSPVKTPAAAAKKDSSSSDSSDSDSSSSDSEPEKTVKKSPVAQKSPFTTSAVKQVVKQSESSSDSDSDSESDT